MGAQLATVCTAHCGDEDEILNHGVVDPEKSAEGDGAGRLEGDSGKCTGVPPHVADDVPARGSSVAEDPAIVAAQMLAQAQKARREAWENLREQFDVQVKTWESLWALSTRLEPDVKSPAWTSLKEQIEDTLSAEGEAEVAVKKLRDIQRSNKKSKNKTLGRGMETDIKNVIAVEESVAPSREKLADLLMAGREAEADVKLPTPAELEQLFAAANLPNKHRVKRLLGRGRSDSLTSVRREQSVGDRTLGQNGALLGGG